MHLPRRSIPHSLPLVCLAVLLCVLFVAGGASRADAIGQALVLGATWLLVIVAILFDDRPVARAVAPPALLLLGLALLMIAQLVPLPPSVWMALPGRDLIAGAAAAGEGQGWRCWSLVPGATAGTLAGLAVPAATLLFMAKLERGEQRWALDMLMVAITLAMLVGLAQFGGLDVIGLLINDRDSLVSGIFANRNHFSLFLVLGCLLAPVWVFRDGKASRPRGMIAIALVLSFVLTILTLGSRAGLALSLPALLIGLALVRRPMARMFRGAPRWAAPALAGGMCVAVGAFVLVSVATDRAVSLDRLLAVDPGQDMRSRGLPTVLAMIREFFPAGAGFGSFDAVFRMHEPLALIKPTYFNHAHNDFLEIALDAGLPGLMLLGATAIWWAWASLRAWRAGAGSEQALPKLGSAVLLFIAVASAFDYPARTPMMMAVVAIASVWLASYSRGAGNAALTGD